MNEKLTVRVNVKGIVNLCRHCIQMMKLLQQAMISMQGMAEFYNDETVGKMSQF